MSLIHNPFDIAVFNIHHSNIAAPGAGNSLTLSPISNARAELIACSFILTTDATAVNRHIIVRAVSPSYLVQIGSSPVLQTASLAYQYVFGVGLNDSVAAVNSNVVGAIANGIYILENWSWRFIVENIQAADTITNIFFHTKFWTFEQ